MLRRRATVLCVYGGYLALVAAIYGFQLHDKMLPSFPAAIFAVAAWIGVGIFMSDKTYWSWGNAPAIELDERQLQTRMTAYWLAYCLFMTIVFVGLVAVTMGSDMLGIKAWRVDDSSAVLWGVFLLGLTLPAAILMWTDASDVSDQI